MKKKYDVTIVGAGIGGLVCGCYLAKAGLKVLIVEQHDKPGGYCTSFQRKGYRFDVGVHYLGGVRNGVFGSILDELEVKKKIRFIQFDPTERIIIKNKEIYFRKNIKDTKNELYKAFPKEQNEIDNFFAFITQVDFLKIYTKVRKCSFDSLLNQFINNIQLKVLISTLVFGNLGVSAKRASALSAIVLFRQYILDPGYYPLGGTQRLPDVLVDEFKRNKGKLILSEKVIKIILKNKQAIGIKCANKGCFFSEIVVSNIDATETFSKLVPTRTQEIARIKKLEVSPSPFAIYLGLSGKNKINKGVDTWCFFKTKPEVNSREDVEKHRVNWLMICFPTAHEFGIKSEELQSVQIFTTVEYVSRKFWRKHKEQYAADVLKCAERILPNLSESIDIKIVGSPATFEKYTNNRDGAAFGWSSTPSQIKYSILPAVTSIDNLYLTGHWTTIGTGQGGVAASALSGRTTAQLILKEQNNNWPYAVLRL